MLTSIGKKVITTTTAALLCQSKPNHITMIGATPTSGTVLASEATGSSPRCRKPLRSISTPTTKPRPQPMASPISTECTTVCTKSPRRAGAPSISEAQTTLGAGISTLGTSKPTVSSSQNSSTHRPKSSGVPKRTAGDFSLRAAIQRSDSTARPTSTSRPMK